MQQESKPDAILDLERQIAVLTMEQVSLSREEERGVGDRSSGPSGNADSPRGRRLAAIKTEMADLRESFERSNDVWTQEKAMLLRVKELKRGVEAVNREIEVAQRKSDWSKVLSLSLSLFLSVFALN